MAIVFDATLKRVILDTVSVSASEIYSRWVDWVGAGDNSKHTPAFRSLGGDELGDGISVPPYFFLLNGWRIRPKEANHTLTITGNLFVDGGGDPIVSTLGNFNVLVKSVVPVQAQVVSTGGGSGGLDSNQARMLLEMYTLLGLDPANPLMVTNTTRAAGDISQSITSSPSETIVTRDV